ncbi:hypothetical protein VO56_02665 [Mycoplasmopsis gallinacea]|uniref:DNA polymerase III PolC-type n=1 Tax=Mycoplasmopsis gallinacea TaxID=29556 RepID=A0A0D5ZK73_9BACT|nr:hypothetical protein VO56_02665 [Mycoplasmopsis gallinacea]
MYKAFYTHKNFSSFAQEISLNTLESLKETRIKDVIFYEKDKKMDITFTMPYLPKINDFSILLAKMSYYGETRGFLMQPHFEILNYSIEEPEIKNYLKEIIRETNCFKDFTKSIINLNSWEFKSGAQKWVIKQSFINDPLFLHDIEELIKDKMYFYGINKFDLEIVYFETPARELEHKNLSSLIKEMEQNNKFEEDSFESKVARTKRFSNYNARLKNQNYIPVTISEINKLEDIPDNYYVNFQGLIYKYELIDRGTFFIYKYSVTDYKDAISLTYFRNEPLKDEEIFKVGQSVDVYGMVDNRSYDTSVKTIKVSFLKSYDDIISEISDDEEVKRIELNTKSKMNVMDGIMEANEIVELAKKYGHKSVAIVDSNSVQSFPKFFASAKKEGIKPIYGVSFSVIDENHRAILNEYQNSLLEANEYIAFDIETTNLSATFGEIIEFGGSIVRNGMVAEKFQFFIKASEKLSAFTIGLTKITDQMLEKEGLELQEGLQKIYEILNNRIAIAHNAKFDMNFILEKFKQNNIPYPNTVYIDSLMVSRILFQEKSKHSLGDFCSNLGVLYDSNVAHRADYDADVLAQAWIKSINKFKEMDINDLDQLYNYKAKAVYEKTRPDQITVLVKNQIGLKNLFKLVTLSLIQRYFKGPKIFYQDLIGVEGILIGSGGIRSPLIDAILYSSEDNVDRIISKFDYVEIPQPNSLEHLITDDGFSREQIEISLKNLYKKAKSLGKIPVAISDARYERKEHREFFKPLVYAKGIGNVPHFLFNYQKAAEGTLKIPQLHFLTTKEMKQAFTFLGNVDDINEVVIENTHKINQMIDDNIEVIKKDLYTPIFDNSKSKLPDLVYKTAHEKYGEKLPKIVEERIKKEIEPILKYGFDVIYWISHILVKKSLDNGYLVGSRGSVGSSLVATLSGITEVNPLPPHYICSNCKNFELVENTTVTSGFDLDDKDCDKCGTKMDKDGHTIPFETFLGFDADKVPDIDLNFSGEYQGEIHNEIKRLFGESHTFRAGTISTIKSKTAYGYIKKAVEEYGLPYSPAYIDFLSTKIEGVKRTTGQHPGGIIIIPKEYDVEDFTPSNYPADDIALDWKTTHFDFHAIHDNVLKLDILGHLDPTAIRMLERLTGIDVKKDIPKKDPRVMSLFSSTKELGISPSQIGDEKTGALGIPEFGTNFVRRMLNEAAPTSFADLISLSGLSHGTDVWTNNAQTLIKEKNMTIKDVISCRDDIMVYLINKGVDPLYSFKVMEQVRKGKGISNEQEVELKKHDVPDWYIESMKKIAYMFPKAHATAYVLMAWRIAWFKLYHPLAYYATFLTTRVEEFDVTVMANDPGAKKINAKLKELSSLSAKKVKDEELIVSLECARELYARGFTITNIQLTKSLDKEWVIDYQNKALIPPFSAIKGLGGAMAEKIIIAREEKPYRTKEDFAKRSGINSTLFGIVKEMGVLDELQDTDQMTLF